MKKSELNNLIRERAQEGVEKLPMNLTQTKQRAVVATVREIIKDLAEEIRTLEEPKDERIDRLIEIEREIIRLTSEKNNIIKEL
jgi:hypothetical protein